MYQSVNFSAFCDAFAQAGRKDQFTYEGKRALFDYLEQYEQDMGEDIELDVIALCCDFTEYDSATEAAGEYFDFEGMTYDPDDGHELETADDVEAKAIKYLEDNTTVIKTSTGGVLIQNF